MPAKFPVHIRNFCRRLPKLCMSINTSLPHFLVAYKIYRFIIQPVLFLPPEHNQVLLVQTVHSDLFSQFLARKACSFQAMQTIVELLPMASLRTLPQMLCWNSSFKFILLHSEPESPWELKNLHKCQCLKKINLALYYPKL